MTLAERQPRILYVEDDARSLKVMRVLLISRMKLTDVHLMEDSTDFLARADAIQPRPDVVFLDIHVTPHNGFEMLSILRQLPGYERTPIVALTASVMNEEVADLRHAGFDGCLAKPLDQDVFPQILEDILNGETIWRIFE